MQGMGRLERGLDPRLHKTAKERRQGRRAILHSFVRLLIIFLDLIIRIPKIAGINNRRRRKTSRKICSTSGNTLEKGQWRRTFMITADILKGEYLNGRTIKKIR
jgi:hypothetical protein